MDYLWVYYELPMVACLNHTVCYDSPLSKAGVPFAKGCVPFKTTSVSFAKVDVSFTTVCVCCQACVCLKRAGVSFKSLAFLPDLFWGIYGQNQQKQRNMKQSGARSAPGFFWGIYGQKAAKTKENEAIRRAKRAAYFSGYL